VTQPVIFSQASPPIFKRLSFEAPATTADLKGSWYQSGFGFLSQGVRVYSGFLCDFGESH